jgi:DUF4097 and DUF4098 domain-containing protein YvlB
MTRSKSPLRTGLWSLGLLLLALPLGCDLPLFTASETVSDVFKTSATPRIVVETFNGSIDISNGAQDEVVVEVTKRAGGFDQGSADRNLENIEVSMAEKDNEVRISVQRHGYSMGDCGASVVIAAPKGAKVDLKSSNGYIVTEGMQGGIAARTSNGRVEVYEGTGQIEAESSNGSIHIEATGAGVIAHTSNAKIEFEGTLTDQSQHFRTSNGRIEVTLPADSQFRFQASTSNARVDCEFPYQAEGSESRRRKSGTVGDDPKGLLKLATSNASIDIRRDGQRKPPTQRAD